VANQVKASSVIPAASGRLTDEENNRLNNEAVRLIKENSPGYFGIGTVPKAKRTRLLGISMGSGADQLYIRAGSSYECLPSGSAVRGMVSVTREPGAKSSRPFVGEHERTSRNPARESYKLLFAGQLKSEHKGFIRKALGKLDNARDVTVEFKKPEA
jgi:hypothetical protein